MSVESLVSEVYALCQRDVVIGVVLCLVILVPAIFCIASLASAFDEPGMDLMEYAQGEVSGERLSPADGVVKALASPMRATSFLDWGPQQACDETACELYPESDCCKVGRRKKQLLEDAEANYNERLRTVLRNGDYPEAIVEEAQKKDTIYLPAHDNWSEPAAALGHDTVEFNKYVTLSYN